VEEPRSDVSNVLNLGSLEEGMHRQRHDVAGEPLRDRKIARTVAKVSKRRLQVQRHRIVHRREDAVGLEMRSKRIASLHADDEKMVHGLVAAIVVGTRDA
jgi:hypothetical protein